jgi:hypothetical protein
MAKSVQREAKKREEYLEMQEASGPVQLGHRLADQTTTRHSGNKGQKSKSSYRPGIEYLLSQSSACALLDFQGPVYC